MDSNQGKIDDGIIKIIQEKNEINKQKALESSMKDRQEQRLSIKQARKHTVAKKVAVSAIVVLAAAGTLVTVPKVVDTYNSEMVTTAFEGRYGDKLHDIVSRTANPKDGNFDYVEIADEIRDLAKNTNELDNILYELYNDYGKLKGFPMYNGITDKTIQYIPKDENNLEFYEGLDDYIHTKGFKNLEEYDSVMRDKVLKEYSEENSVSKGVK